LLNALIFWPLAVGVNGGEEDFNLGVVVGVLLEESLHDLREVFQSGQTTAQVVIIQLIQALSTAIHRALLAREQSGLALRGHP
jgi:hypothetical protein